MADDHGRHHGPGADDPDTTAQRPYEHDDVAYDAPNGAPAHPHTPDTGPPLAPALALLHALAAPAAPGASLPGEEAALSAFRAARAATAAAGTARARAAGAAPGGERAPAPRRKPAGPHAVERADDRPSSALAHRETGPVRPRQRSRRGRPARAALVLALAGCAVSGVAVAAGVVGLPGPFRAGAGTPARSGEEVPVVDHGRDARTVRPDAVPGPSYPSRTPEEDVRPLPPPVPHPGGRHGTDPTATPGSPSPSAAPDERPGTGREDDPPARDDGHRGRRHWAARLCHDYLLEGKWREKADDDSVRTLEHEAGGPSGVRDYCERLLRDDHAEHGHEGAPADGETADEDEDGDRGPHGGRHPSDGDKDGNADGDGAGDESGGSGGRGGRGTGTSRPRPAGDHAPTPASTPSVTFSGLPALY
ncbi:hypothetical protein [Streptomyces caatingaensis]|uniref:Uncharacterized protein n=1 Tax=Streptomyces caatingaensis TaxID=1678637 RepID=A0A0K9XDZ1_9ACTN|nr:hypothetical protein [Streptomyces caatingaensis]KNB51605.1 hypothetical protein AC230_14700 [Streptomyces caatingaensis]